jgi:hypothetical protein
MACTTITKITYKSIFFFQNAIKLGKKEMKNQTYHTLTRYSKFFTKDYEDAYQNLALFNELTTALNIEEKLNKAKVAGINLEIDEYKEIDKIGNEYKTKESLLLKAIKKKKKKILILFIYFILFFFLLYIFREA